MENTTGPAIWFEPPIGFVETPLDGTLEERFDLMADVFERQFPDVPLEQRLLTAANAELMLQAQFAQGLAHLSNCLYRAGDGTVLHAVFSIFVMPLDTGSPLTFADRRAGELAAARPRAEVGVLHLPYGRAIVATEDRVVPLPGALYGLAQDGESLVRQIEVMIPHPVGGHLVLIVLSTEYLDHWEDLVPVLGTALEAVSFFAPLPGLAGRALEEPATARQSQSEPAVSAPSAAVQESVRRAFG